MTVISGSPHTAVRAYWAPMKTRREAPRFGNLIKPSTNLPVMTFGAVSPSLSLTPKTTGRGCPKPEPKSELEADPGRCSILPARSWIDEPVSRHMPSTMVKVSPVASLSLPAWIQTGLFAFFFMRFVIDGLQISLCQVIYATTSHSPVRSLARCQRTDRRYTG